MIYIYSTPLPRVGCDKRSILIRNIVDFNKEFSFSLSGCPIKANESILPYHLLIIGKRTEGFMPFTRVLARSGAQTAPYRIWNRVTDSIYYDDNRYSERAF